MLLSFPPVAMSPRGYLSLGAIIQTQETKLECPDMECISVKPLSGLSARKNTKNGVHQHPNEWYIASTQRCCSSLLASAQSERS